ncbi:MAG: thymidylate synthase [Gammaproteobacteria bacterium]|nr:thymidylate synthase [Gammaproteobacteria bacterium]
MKAYQDILKRIISEGHHKDGRNGGTISLHGAEIVHDMSKGFPIVTIKRTAFRLICLELEAWIRGITDKQWLQDRGCHIWDGWCDPKLIPEGSTELREAAARQERDLGPIYGWQWRHFGAEYRGHSVDYSGEGIDQLAAAAHDLIHAKTSRRILVSAWNPSDLHRMSIPSCYFNFQLLSDGQYLDLVWSQRSADSLLGLPFDMALHGLLLAIFARHAGLEARRLVGHIGDAHVYDNHLDGLETMLRGRKPLPLPKLELSGPTDPLLWRVPHARLLGYKHAGKLPLHVSL